MPGFSIVSQWSSTLPSISRESLNSGHVSTQLIFLWALLISPLDYGINPRVSASVTLLSKLAYSKNLNIFLRLI